MIRLAKYAAAKLALLLALGIVLVAIGISLARMLAPMVSEYRLEAEQWAHEAIGAPVQIGELKASWHGFNPRLVLKDAAILDARSGRPTIRFAEIHLGVSLLDILRGETPMPRQVTFVGTSIKVKLRSDGSVVVAGLEGATQGKGDGGGLFLLPPSLTLRDSEVFWENQFIGAAPLRFTDVEVDFRNDGDRHQLRASLVPPGGTGSRMELLADIQGALHEPGAWVGDVFLKGERLPLQTLLKNRLPEGYHFERGVADMGLWSHWEGGRVNRLEGGISWRNLRLSAGRLGEEGYRLFDLERLAARFQWLEQERGWRLEVGDLEYKGSGPAWPRSGLSLQARYGERNRLQLDLGADFLRIQDLAAVFDLFPLPPGLAADALAGVQPQADVEDLRLHYAETEDRPQWAVAGRFHDLQAQPWHGIPGAQNLEAEFWANQDRGVLELQSGHSSLDFAGLFRAPLRLDEVEGQVGWHRLAEGGWRIQSHELTANNEDLKTRTRILMDLPAEPGESPFLDLQTDFVQGNVSSAHRYLPVAIMPKGVVDWLDRSLVSGRVTAGSCVVRGRLRDFPYEKNSAGRFEVLFGTEDLVLDYWPGWPRIERATAEIRFLNNSFDAWIYGGELLSSEVQRAHGRIRDLAGASPFELEGVVSGPFTDELRLLRETPLAEDFASMVSDMRGEGRARLAVDFAIPLKHTGPRFRIDGRLSFRDSTLHLDDWQLPLTGIRGDLEFNQDGVRAKGIQANSLGSRLNIDVMASPSKKVAGTRIVATAPLAGKTLAGKFPGMNLEMIQGTSDWTLQLDIPRKDGKTKAPVSVAVSSDLRGSVIELPPPLGKVADGTRRLQLATKFSDRPVRPLYIRYADLVDAALRVDVSDPQNMRLQGGELRLGGDKANLPAAGGLRVYGRLDELDLTPWLGMAESGGGGDLSLLELLDLSVGKLTLGDLGLDQFALRLKPEGGAWQGEVGSDRFQGEISIPRDLQAEPIRARLKQLRFDYDPEAMGETAQEAAEPSDLDPRRFPALDLQSEHLLINDQDLGSLSLQLERVADGLRLETLSVESEHNTLDASGSWLAAEQGASTDLSLELETEGLGQLLADLGFTQNMKDASATIDSQLTWPGSPMDMGLRSVAGELDIHVGKGRFLQVEPGVGRIFGLLNIGVLQRRLMLDFSDLFEEGFSFDRIEGHFTVDGGDAYTSNLKVESPSAMIDIAGRTGLVAQDFDQVVTVTPQVTGTLPVVGGIVGGPAVGGALFLAQKLLGKRMDKVTRYEYRVSGSWDDPEITREKFSLGKQLKLFSQDENEEEPAVP